jgi:hypothetical protein
MIPYHSQLILLKVSKKAPQNHCFHRPCGTFLQPGRQRENHCLLPVSIDLLVLLMSQLRMNKNYFTTTLIVTVLVAFL